MSAFNDAWTLLKQQMSLLPFGFATGDPTQDALAYLGVGPGAQVGPITVPQSQLDDRFEDFLDRQKTRGIPQYQLNVTRDESGYRGKRVGLNPYLTTDGQAVGRMPMSPTGTRSLRGDITAGRGRDVVAHTSMPVDELITDYHGNTHLMDSATSIPEFAFYPTGSNIDDEHQGKGLYIRSLLSLLSTPEAMGLSAKDVAREQRTGSEDEFDLSDVDPELFDELYGQRGLMSPPDRTGGKGGSDRSHQLLSERYKRIMDLLGENIHTYGEGQTLSNIVDMAERGEGMFGGGVGGKLKHNLEEGSFGELRNPRTKEALKNPRGKTFFYDPIPVDVGKNPLEQETFGDLRRFDLAGLPVRVERQITPTKRKRLKQTRLEDFSQPEPEPEPSVDDLDELFGSHYASNLHPANPAHPAHPDHAAHLRRVAESLGRPRPPPSRTPEETAARQRIIDRLPPTPSRRDRTFTRQREHRVQEAIDSLGDLFSSGQINLGEVTRNAMQNAMTGEEFNERLVNTERDVDIENSLKYFNEHVTERHFDEHGFAYPNSFDSLPEDMQINLARDVAFLENIQSQNSRSDGVREALRRAEEQYRDRQRFEENPNSGMSEVFNPDVPATNTVGSGALRRSHIFDQIDRAIARIRILNHHLRTYPMELRGGGGPLEQEEAHILLRNHLDSFFHPIHGNMIYI